jgi:hypothetical protein
MPKNYQSLLALMNFSLVKAAIFGINRKAVAKSVIVRLMRPLTALGIFIEVDSETYTSTPISEMLVTPALLGGFQFMYSFSLVLPLTCNQVRENNLTIEFRYAGATRSLANLPFYLEKTGYRNVSGAPGPFQDAHKTDMGMFQWLISDPPMMTNFNNFMSGQRMNRQDWYDFFPVDDILLAGANATNPDATLLIDVAGGEGHDAQAFHRRFPNHPGKVILQDLPPVIENIKPGQIDSKIICQPYDFFTPQPIHGARAYYFRSIFHDWPDHECVKILKQTAVAMKKDYSKVLIFEWILPEKNTPLYPALLDINMMAVLNGMERTRKQWIALLEQAGLKVIKFWTVADDIEGLIEVELM